MRRIRVLTIASEGEMWFNLVPMQYKDKDDFTQFIYSPLCSYSSGCHRNKEVKNYLLNVAVEGTVSVIMGLAAASAKYQRKETTSSEREVISLSSSLYARKGFLLSGKERPVYVDKGVRFKVEGIEIGLEEVLIVTTEVERKQTTTENKLKVEVKVLFFTISKKMESIQQSSSQKGFVVIDHYSSKTGQWRHVEFDASQYQEALTEVHRIEADMSTIPDVVNRTPFSQLSHMRVVAKPCAQENENMGVFIELQNDIKTLQIEIAESEALRTNEKTERLRSLLTELQSLTVKDCSWEILDNIKRNIK